MPSSDSESDDLVFLSPEKSFNQQGRDQGASPTLRRSSRKRKSVSIPGNMSKTSATKKKKSSPDPGKSMPRIPRTPQGAAAATEDRSGTPGEGPEGPGGLESLLLAMEGRLAARIDKASEAAREAVALAKSTNAALEDLELKVEASEGLIREELKETEERVMKTVQDRVKDMVDNQLRAAGFDQDLSAGDLTVRSSARQSSYAGVLSLQQSASDASRPPACIGQATPSRQDRQEEKFWKARRSLRIWPVDSFDRKGVTDFLTDKLKMDNDFIKEELGLLTVCKVRDPRSKGRVKNEAVVTFDTKQIRDAVRARAANLANYRQEAGMRLDHLQEFWFVNEPGI